MAIIKRSKVVVVGLQTDLDNLNSAIAAEATNRASAITAATDPINTSLAEKLVKTANLSDLADAAAARTNLDVPSNAEVTAAIDAAKAALGSNTTVADIIARDALTGLDTDDKVTVLDDGDGKWAVYRPTAVDVNGAATGWQKMADEDALQNSITAGGVKAAYESNADTNVFTDAEKAALAKAVLNDALVQDLSVSAPTTEVASAAAAKAYADSVAGQQVASESLVVAGDNITLANAPAGGVSGILNFGTVRYINGTGEAFEAPVVATADPKVFTIQVDNAGEWNTFTVKVQYLY